MSGLFKRGRTRMLVLSRKSGECVLIGAEIEVKVLDVHEGRVRLGFSGSPSIPIRRQELPALSATAKDENFD